ncbi:MAG: hypothetical protein M3Y69_01730 [Verrucomicrobiota bacterium]|nr:hypothetical protein [Verrucomicrobiota bacterium]
MGRAFVISLLFFAANALAGTMELTPAQQDFRREIGQRAQAAEKANIGALGGVDSWLFLTSELRFLVQGTFWGESAAKVARSRKPETADPIPAIVDFQQQLQARGIELLLVPVPPKASVYPEKIAPAINLVPAETAPYLSAFLDELRSRGIKVVDLAEPFRQNRESNHGPVFCKTDSHWSGFGCVLAAQAITAQVPKELAEGRPRREFDATWKDVAITGDLNALLGATGEKTGPENLPVRTVAEKGTGAGVQPDPISPLLVIGDSHTLVFHDFLAERAGLIDQLAAELGFAPDLIGTRGSGATAVRLSLYRKSNADPGYLAKKKVVVWCFAAREFTEADQGWVIQPIAK